MILRRPALLLAFGLLVPLVLVDAPAGALDQDLTASVVAGPPGTVVTLSSASCTPTGELSEAYLSATLYSGTGADEKLAGVGEGPNGQAEIVIPDWLDPDQPAVIEAECYVYDPDSGGGDDITYDPIAFDVEPGSGTPIQVPSFSRTTLQSGQGTLVSSAGCGDAAFVTVAAIAGTDLSGRDTFTDEVAFGFDTAEGGSFALPLAMTNASVVISYRGDPSNPTVETYEEPNTLAPGPYSVFPYCVSDGGSALVLEPTVIQVEGVATTDGTDLTVAAGTPDATVTGECTAGDVAGTVDGETLEDFDADLPGDPSTSLLRPRALRSLLPDDGSVRLDVTGRSLASGDRIVDAGTSTEFAVTPGADGTWSYADSAGFDEGFLTSWATCGDPLADGFYYDGQIADVAVEAAPPVVPPLVPPTVPAPPANAVPGSPTYAG